MGCYLCHQNYFAAHHTSCYGHFYKYLDCYTDSDHIPDVCTLLEYFHLDVHMAPDFDNLFAVDSPLGFGSHLDSGSHLHFDSRATVVTD